MTPTNEQIIQDLRERYALIVKTPYSSELTKATTLAEIAKAIALLLGVKA